LGFGWEGKGGLDGWEGGHGMEGWEKGERIDSVSASILGFLCFVFLKMGEGGIGEVMGNGIA
jgi:hypothetical protein